ncbi:MAG: S8 family serine peptidase [Anaerolineales bacterium]
MKIKRILTLVSVLIILISMTGILSAGASPSEASAQQPYKAGTMRTYVVLYKSNSVASDAATVIAKAGGSLVYSYDEIGVVIASSDNELFGSNLLKNNKIQGASSTAGFGVQHSDEFLELYDASGPPPGDLPNSPVSDTDPLFNLQWDMVQIHVPEAHAITGGSPSVLVGDIDTGIDFTHPDLVANIDFANSVSCVGGVPNQDPAAWNDEFGHGTHTAGTIAAVADNGIGIVGVAPNVKIAAIKATDSNGFLYPEYVICAFMWAATHGVDVTNNSYFVDPWLFNCRNDPVQRAIWESLRRAIRYAMSQGVTVVASAGNQNDDLAHPTVDTISPDDGTALTREITNACGVIPAEIPGVVTVTANGNLMQKSYYSSYGVGVVQLVAPGGDSRFQRTPAATRGTVLSTYPGNRYAYLQGTSMASPHVAGVAALIISQYGKMPQGRVSAYLTSTADPIECPPNPFNPGPPFNYLATCQGGAGYNSFYGHGQVNAFNAVTHSP